MSEDKILEAAGRPVASESECLDVPFTPPSDAERYAWDCAEDMRGWAMRAEDSARKVREENYALRREVAALRHSLSATTGGSAATQEALL